MNNNDNNKLEKFFPPFHSLNFFSSFSVISNSSRLDLTPCIIIIYLVSFSLTLSHSTAAAAVKKKLVKSFMNFFYSQKLREEITCSKSNVS